VSGLIHHTDRAEIWQGDCLDPEHVAAVMGGRKADLRFVDAPYSERTHDGHGASGGSDGSDRKALEYAAWSSENVSAFCAAWLPMTDGWFASITDNILAPAWASAMEADDRLVFAPLPWVELGSRCRLTGDGPSGWTCWVIVSRPRRLPFSKWGTLPGAYIGPGDKMKRPDRIIGGKSFPLMRDLIADYSRPGDLVVDPCLGGGTTMVAALAEGRRCIGMEKDLGRATKCKELLIGSRGNEKQRGLFW
jgi:site-specific DNA-methyltransferase (adenine-specific)